MYSASTIGATINMHYCMNKLAGITLKSTSNDKCPKCGMKNTGCCKDEKKQFKLHLDQQKLEQQFLKHLQGVSLDLSFTAATHKSINKFEKQNWVKLHAPPLLQGIDKQAFFGSFLI